MFFMIGNALDFVVQQLNDFIANKTGARKKIVKLSGLVTAEDGLSVKKDNTLALSVVNISEEGILANQHMMKRQGDEFVKQSPAVHLNVYLLISSLFKDDDYQMGLNWLSLAISFFQIHSSFNSTVSQMPSGLDKLSFELVNLDIDNLNGFWGAMGVPFQPSVIYKMRMLIMDRESFISKFEEFKDPEA